MSKSRSHKSELQHLRNELNRLRKENRQLKHQLNQRYDFEEESIIIEEDEKKCPICYKGMLNTLLLPHKTLFYCELCGYRK